MIKVIELYLVSLLVIVSLYSIWLYGYSYGCLIFLVPLVIVGVISYSYIENRMHDRSCFSKCFIRDNTFISNILAGSLGVTIIGLIISIVSTLPLLNFSLNLEMSFGVYIVFHIFLLIILYKYISIKLGNSVNDNYLYILSKKITTSLMSVFIFLIYTYIFMKSDEPIYLKESLETSLNFATNSIHSQCIYIDRFLRFFREMDVVNWWLLHKSEEVSLQSSSKIVHTLSNVGQPLLWGVFVLKNALISFALNSFIMQIIYVIDKFVFNSIYNEKGEKK